MSRLRLFVAVPVPDTAREHVEAAAARLHGHAPSARWSDPAGWHLTLAFLGWVQPDTVAALVAALRQVAGAHAPFPLSLTGAAGTFGRRVLWAEVGASAPLDALAGDVRAALQPLGFPPEERAFHAHLTLARAPKGSRLPRDLPERYDAEPVSWQADAVHLMRSHLGPQGARYEIVEACPLGR